MSKVSFLAGGGANFIGKSFYRLKLGNVHIGIDWGGGFPDGEPEYDGPLDYLFFSHAHYDHMGMAPRVLRKFPGVQMFAHPATIELAEVNWRQGLRKYQQERIPAPFSESAMAETGRAIKPLEDGKSIVLANGIIVYPLSASHILGSQSFLFTYLGENYFFTNDVCYHDRSLMTAAPQIVLKRSKLLARESTYISDSFEDRKKIEADLVASTQKVLDNGGQVLIAALSIDRTQDAYTILERSGISPLYIDGSRSTSQIYQDYLGQDLFRYAGNFQGKSDRERRRKRTDLVNRGQPVVVIASSGMMYKNTLSAWWAEHFIYRDKAAIFLVNYQDPCGQGYVLDHSEKGNFLIFNNSLFRRRCEVKHFNLSAHMDKVAGEELEERLNPEVVVCTHGEDAKIEQYLNEHRNGRTRVKSLVGKEIEL